MPGSSSINLSILAAGLFAIAVVSLVTVFVWSQLLPAEINSWYGAVRTAETTPEATLQLESIDPRAVADNMFNHVVDAAEAGDTVQLQEFLPLAVIAYAEAAPLDADGLFHLSTLHRIADDPDESLLSARTILERDPDHLLGLGAAAAASEQMGRDDDVTAYYSRLVEVYEVQVNRSLNEYLGHATFLGTLRDDAEGYLRGR